MIRERMTFAELPLREALAYKLRKEWESAGDSMVGWLLIGGFVEEFAEAAYRKGHCDGVTYNGVVTGAEAGIALWDCLAEKSR